MTLPLANATGAGEETTAVLVIFALTYLGIAAGRVPGLNWIVPASHCWERLRFWFSPSCPPPP